MKDSQKNKKLLAFLGGVDSFLKQVFNSLGPLLLVSLGGLVITLIFKQPKILKTTKDFGQYIDAFYLLMSALVVMYHTLMAMACYFFDAFVEYKGFTFFKKVYPYAIGTIVSIFFFLFTKYLYFHAFVVIGLVLMGTILINRGIIYFLVGNSGVASVEKVETIRLEPIGKAVQVKEEEEFSESQITVETAVDETTDILFVNSERKAEIQKKRKKRRKKRKANKKKSKK